METNKILYRPNGGQVFMFPMVAVFARSFEEARTVAGPGRNDQLAYFDLALDSAAAQSRLGLWGRPDLADQVMRGDTR